MSSARPSPVWLPGEDKDNGAYLDSLGWVLFRQQRFKEAKEALLKAVEDKSAQHIEIYDHLGDTYRPWAISSLPRMPGARASNTAATAAATRSKLEVEKKLKQSK